MANEIYHRSNWGNAVNDNAWGDTYEKFDATNEMFVRSDNYENSNETDKLMAAINPKPSILLTPTAYDNGSLHSVKPVSGENFIPYSEDFSQSQWVKQSSGVASAPVVTSDYAVSPDGTLSADRVVFNINGGTTSSDFSQLAESVTSSVGDLTNSIFIKSNTASNYNMSFIDPIGGTPTSIVVTSEWQRFNITSTLTTTTSTLKLRLRGNEATSDFADVSVWGAQLERGSLGAYTPTNGTAIKNGSFDFTRGTTATRVNEQGLIEDVQILSGELVQNGDFEQIGSELITNGDFATDLSGWTTVGTNATNTITWEQGGARIISTDANIGIRQLNILTIGKAYKLTCDVNVTTGSLGLDGSVIVGSTINLVNGFNEIYFVATSTTFKIKRTSTVTNCLLDNVSIKEVGQNWSFGTGWSIEDGKAYRGVEASGSNLQQNSILTIGKKYKVTLDVLENTGTNKVFIGTGTAFTLSGTGTQTFTGVCSSNTTLYIQATNNNSEVKVDNISVIEITDDTDLPRIDYTDGTGSLLLEPQSTNLQLRSQEFDNPVWNAQRATLTANDAISPDGTLNAYKLTHTSGSSGYVFDTIPTVNSGDSRLISVFAKYIDDEVFKIVTFTDSGNAVFNLLNGTVTSVGGTISDAKIENYGNGWYRCSCKYTATTTATRNYGFYLDDTSKQGVHIWGAQVEEQSYATSYIPTSGSTVTRDADVCNNSGSSDLINSTEGVLYCEIAALADDLTFRSISLSDGTNDNRVLLRYRTTTNQINLFIRADGTTIVNSTKALTDITNYSKFAIKYKSGDIALWIDGVEAKTNTNTFTLIGLNRLNFDAGSGSDDFYGKVKSVAVFKEALTDAELTALTT